MFCFVPIAFESSVAIIYPRFDQSSAGGFNYLDGLLCVQRGLKFEPDRNKAVNFTADIKPELLSYLSDSACVGDVVVRKSFALSSK